VRERGVDISLVIKHRLNELGLDQKDLAGAARVTESYVSQLLARKKAPPAPARTDIYEKMGLFLKLPAGELSKLADVQRRMELKKKIAEPQQPLFKDCRALILGKCAAARRKEVRRLFEKESFGELERLVTQKVLAVSQGVAREQLRNEQWLRSMAKSSGRSYEQMRVTILEFLDTGIFDISVDSCVSFLDPVIEWWDIDLTTFAIEIKLKRGGLKRFEFIERTDDASDETEPGLKMFLADKLLSGDVREEEVEFLRTLRFRGKHPTAIYYYRELQNLRDPLHFSTSGKSS